MTTNDNPLLSQRDSKEDAFRHLGHAMQARLYAKAAQIAKEIHTRGWLLSTPQTLELLVAFDAGTDDADLEGHKFVDVLRAEVSMHKKKHAAEIIDALATLAEIHLRRRNVKRASGVFGAARELELPVPVGSSALLHYNAVIEEYARQSNSDLQEAIGLYRLG